MCRHRSPIYLPQLRVNLSVVRGHYEDANRLHVPSRRRDAMYTAVRDIPLLIAEIERLWALAGESRQQYLRLSSAVADSVAAGAAGDPDPLSALRDGLPAL